MVSEDPEMVLNIPDVRGETILVVLRISREPEDEAHQLHPRIDANIGYALCPGAVKREAHQTNQQ
jgi:hypothetical protein